MSKGNKGLFNFSNKTKAADKAPEQAATSPDVSTAVTEKSTKTPLKATNSSTVLEHRQTSLQAMAEGAMIQKTLRWVEPAECRMWAEHDRNYALLNEENCHDLISGILEQGRQTTPAVVRKLPKGDKHAYEIICGARRHWVVSYLRNVKNRPEYKFLVEVKELTDEEAFRESDVENRARRDISEYERAQKYLKGMKKYYKTQKAMAERLEMLEDELSRFLNLAKLPREIVEAYATPNDIKIAHAKKLVPLLNDPTSRDALAKAATQVKDQQAYRRTVGEPEINGAGVFKLLLKAVEKKGEATDAQPLATYRSTVGNTLLVVTKRDKTSLHFNVPLKNGATIAELTEVFAKALKEHVAESVVKM
jgi:ParB family chromosome partitioning protein